MKLVPIIILSGLLAAGFSNRAHAAGEETVKLVITGGHGTDPRDHGRPVVLIASALGVAPEVFRDAFSHVKPAAPGTQPDPAQVQRNKSALLGALARDGVTNDSLDRVSNYYRYQPGSGRLWPTASATAFATIKGGAVTSIRVAEGGSGYSSPPDIFIPGHPEIVLKARLAFGRDLKTNGSVASITD
jgi:hypothetical protein